MAGIKYGRYTLLHEDMSSEQNIDPASEPKCSSEGAEWPKAPRTSHLLSDTVLWRIGYGTVIWLQITIIILLLLRTGKIDRLVVTLKEVETGSDINGLYKTCKEHLIRKDILYIHLRPKDRGGMD